MQQIYDLHCHSTASDGSLSPTELVALARTNNVDVLALTDHDVTHGIHEAWHQANENGIEFIPGIEISVTWRHQTIHIVGLGIDPDNAQLQQGLESILEFRSQRAEKIAERLAKSGIAGALAGAQKFAGGQILSRTHFAHFLVEQGYAKDMKKVFKKFLVRNKPGYVPGQWASLEDALNWIKAAGGIAVLAHPARYAISNGRLKEFIAQFKELGGEAIEVVSGSHSQDEVLRMGELCKYFAMSASSGSDYHGPNNSYRELGYLHQMPPQCQPVWQSRRWSEMLERLKG
jgi:predicted metal-dependent phosphoesterase TrpH